MAASISLATRIPLNQGGEMPVFGLGVWQAGAGDATRSAVQCALEAGYRLIDTAKMYGNEREVGEAIRASGIPREEIFVTTKLASGDQGYESALAAAQESLNQLDLGYIDLYLIHWPSATPPSRRLESWRALQKLHSEGVCRAVGVSNYTVRHLEEIRSDFELQPAVNQVEFHPFLYQHGLLEVLPTPSDRRGGVLAARPRPSVGGRADPGGRVATSPHDGPGDAPLGAPARSRRDPQVLPTGTHHRERPGVRFRAHRRGDDGPQRARRRLQDHVRPGRDPVVGGPGPAVPGAGPTALAPCGHQRAPARKPH